jgi:hypothetical protein
MGQPKQNEQPMTAQLFDIVQSGHSVPGEPINSKRCGNFFLRRNQFGFYLEQQWGNKATNDSVAF